MKLTQRSPERLPDAIIAPDSEGWFEVEGINLPTNSCWIVIEYAASFLVSPQRPLLRMIGSDFVADEILPAPVFGRGYALVALPANTRRLMLSPSMVSTPALAFRLIQVSYLNWPGIMARAFVRNPGKAAAGVIAKLAGFEYLAKVALRHAAAPTKLEKYKAWRKRRHRNVDPDGVDNCDDLQVPYIHRLIDPKCINKEILSDLIIQWRDEKYVSSVLYLSREQSEIINIRPEPRLRIWTHEDKSNELLEGKDSDLVFFQDADVRLTDFALTSVAGEAAGHPGALAFYGDEECKAPRNRRDRVLLRTAFDPVLFESLDTLGDAWFIRLSALREFANDMRPSDIALILPQLRESLALRPSACQHIARVLLARDQLSLPRARFQESGKAASRSVTIIIPTRDQPKLLQICMNSLARTLSGLEVQYIIVDNGSELPDTLQLLRQFAENPAIEVLEQRGPFNFAALCNAAAAMSKSRFLLFLNDDTEALAPGWLDPMLDLAARNDVGAVGPRLIYPDGTLQHGGVVLGIDGRAGHFERKLPEGAPGFFQRLPYAHRVTAVTGASLLVEARKFQDVGGFDDVHLPVELNDIDLCLRLVEKGWHSVVSGASVMIHHESKSRGGSWRPDLLHGASRRYFHQKWFQTLRDDPYFSPALSLDGTNATLG